MDGEQRPLFGASAGEADEGLRGRPVLTITGSREIPREAATSRFKQMLMPWFGSHAVWLVGGARGVDTWATEWLVEHDETCWVIVPFTASEQPLEAQSALHAAARLIELNLPRKKSSYIVRNRYMVDRSQVVLGFWTGSKGGTLATHEYALRTGREVHAYRVTTD